VADATEQDLDLHIVTVVGSRREMVVEAAAVRRQLLFPAAGCSNCRRTSGDVALAAEQAFVVYIESSTSFSALS
jgi:hypothetical protein